MAAVSGETSWWNTHSAMGLRFGLVLLLAVSFGGTVVGREVPEGHGSVHVRRLQQVPEKEEKLVKAAEDNDFGEIQQMLDEGFSSEASNSLGMTPLLRAATLGHNEACKALIDGGANVNAVSLSGYSALHFAARRGATEILKMLLDAGADVNSVTDHGATPLFLAARDGQAEAAKILLDYGADSEIRHTSLSPLMTAITSQHADCVAALVAGGADVNTHAEGMMTPLHFAAWPGNEGAIQYLLDGGAKLEAWDMTGNTPLAIAAATGSVKAIELLLESGAQTSSTNNFGLSPYNQLCSCLALLHEMPCDVVACENKESILSQLMPL